MHVDYIPMRWGSGDNYCYILTDDTTKESWIIDPAEPDEVIPELEKRGDALKFTAVVNTHHHYDHAGGNKSLLQYFKQKYGNVLPLYAGKDSPAVSHTPKHKEVLKLGSNIEVQALHTPCHTQDSICWYAVDKKSSQKVLFAGDTLFTAGCGRFFEGTGAEMDQVLNKIFPTFVDEDTKVYPGHEYTASNVKFAKIILKNNLALKNLEETIKGKEFTTGLFTLKDEYSYNPFMRLDDKEVISATNGQKDHAQIMDTLRLMKNKS